MASIRALPRRIRRYLMGPFPYHVQSLICSPFMTMSLRMPAIMHSLSLAFNRVLGRSQATLTLHYTRAIYCAILFPYERMLRGKPTFFDNPSVSSRDTPYAGAMLPEYVKKAAEADATEAAIAKVPEAVATGAEADRDAASMAAQKHKESSDSYEVNVQVVYDSRSYGSGLFVNCAISKLRCRQSQLFLGSVHHSAHKTSSSTLIVYTIRPQDGKCTSTRTNRRLG